MPRDSSGNYTLPPENPVVPNTIIETDWANSTEGDEAAEITNSLDRNGRGAMRAPLLLFDGVAAAPGLAFNLDHSTGLYRDGVSGSLFIVVDGQEFVEFFMDTSDPTTPVASINFLAAISVGDTDTTFQDGTVLQPGVRFTLENGTGMWRPADGQVSLAAHQVEGLRFRNDDGVRFPYQDVGANFSWVRGANPIMRSIFDGFVNGAKHNASGNLIAEQSRVTQLHIGPDFFSVGLATGQVIGNTLTGVTELFKVDATGAAVNGVPITTTANAVLKAGDTMTGPLVLPADPTAPLQAATKAYADLMLRLTGGVLTGALTLAADPASALEAATKQYVDAQLSSLVTTGTIQMTLEATPPSGWLLLTGGTIGNASSGATARANADTQALFTLIWANVIDTWAPVSTGRGASAAADFAAGKTIRMADARGRALFGAGQGTGLTLRALWETLGEERHLQTVAEMPGHDHPPTSPGTAFMNSVGSGGTNQLTGAGSNARFAATTGSTGGGTAFNVMQPSLAVNVKIKL